jgi:hypothetical protein
VLLQTLVMSVVLSMMAVMVMKWVLARYMLAARNYRSSESVAHAQYVNFLFAGWNSNFASIPSNGSMLIDGKTFTFSRTVGSSMRFNVTMQQDL